MDIEKFIKEGVKEKREIYAMFSQEDRGNIVF
ncbi:putative B12-binding Fe-S oxidoreductase [Clostridium botulinum A1 str. CFSAN002368]|nr:putative B12-binding Fe-S oxidoreductase [Clostridium botulinum A1 str. CFSAN002368]